MQSTNTSSPGGQPNMVSPGGDEPSLIQYRSKRRCVMEREKKKKKEWWEEEDVLSDEEDLGDVDSDSSDGPKRSKQRRKIVMPAQLLPPPPNRVFMFSTELANRAAEAVIRGRVPSIVAYHMAQPQNQPYLRVQRNAPEFMMNRPGGNPYRYGNFPGHMPNMDAMFRGARPSASTVGMRPGFNSMQQYQQYLKQQQLEPRNAVAVDELQQMLFGPTNGSKGMFAPAGMPRGMEEQGGPRPPFPGAYSSHVTPGFGQQQMFMNNHQERFRFSQPQNFPSQQQPLPQQSETQGPPQPDEQKTCQPPRPPSQQEEQQVTNPDQQSEVQQNREATMPSSSERRQPLPSQALTPQQAPMPQQAAPQLPVLSPGSSLSSTSPLGSSIRSPPPYPGARASELNTLPGASSVSAPSPTNTNSPQTPHGPLTPRLPTSLASPKDGQRSPFSPNISTSGYTTQMQQQNIRDQAIKLARQSPSLDKPDLQADKGIPTTYSIPVNSRIPSYSGQSSQDMLPQRPNSLNLTRNPSPLGPPPNKSPFLGTVSSPMRMSANPSPMGETSSSHHQSKFSVESLTAPSKEDQRFFHPRLPMQAANPYAPYSQQPGIYYTGNKFLPGMLGQAGQYQFPPHLQTTPQQFFPSNMPPQMYPPHGSFPIHHAGNRDGGM